MRFIKYNPNPAHRNVSDCSVRALSKALDQSWEETYIGLAIQGLLMSDMPHANSSWGTYLKRKGFVRDMAPENMTVSEFADEFNRGTYILALSGHVVCIKNGVLFDSWDSGDEIVLYFWTKK